MSDTVDLLVAFAQRLRGEGVPVGTSKVLDFCHAADLAEPSDLYWAGRTSLVARRLADARAAGADAAVIQAVRGTSAPVCANLGFKEVVPLEFYAWVPPGVDMDLHA